MFRRPPCSPRSSRPSSSSWLAVRSWLSSATGRSIKAPRTQARRPQTCRPQARQCQKAHSHSHCPAPQSRWKWVRELTWDKFQYLLRTTGRLEGYVPQENPLHDYAWLAICTNDCVYYGLAFSDEFVETAQHCTLLDPLGSVLARRKHVAPNWGQSAQVPSQLLRQDQPRHPGQIGCRLLQAGRPEKLRDKGRPPFSCKKLMASFWALALGSPTRPFGLSCLTSQPAQVPRLAAGLLAFYSSRHEEQG